MNKWMIWGEAPAIFGNTHIGKAHGSFNLINPHLIQPLGLRDFPVDVPGPGSERINGDGINGLVHPKEYPIYKEVITHLLTMY